MQLLKLTLFAVVVSSLVFGSFAFAFDINLVDWKHCAYGGCFEYSTPIPKLTSGQNVQFNVFMPDFTCNIYGSINQVDGTCSVKPLIVSADNWTNTKQDVAAMTVRDIQSTPSPVNTNFCPLAYFTVTHEDGYFYIIQNVLDKVFPNYCYKELGNVTIPELAQLSIGVLCVGLVIAIVLAAHKGLNYKP